MSTKTTFKRIALVAVAALSLGVLSVAPASATVSALSVTGAVNGTSTNSAEGFVSDSTTAATFTVSSLHDAALDSTTVTFIVKSGPAAPRALMYFVDSATSGLTLVDSDTAVVSAATSGPARPVASANDTTTGVIASTQGFRLARATPGYVGAKFAIQLDSTSVRTAGTYVYTVVVKGFSQGVAAVTTTQDVSIVVGATTASSVVVDPSKSSATLGAGASFTATPGTDDAVSTLATASATVKAVIRVINNNASNAAAAESITVTVTGPGVVRKLGDSSAGKSIVVIGDGNDDIEILSDGTAGTASISVRTTSVTHAAKSVTFFAANAATTVAAANKPVIRVGTNDQVIVATMKDANGNNWAGQAYIYAASAADALIAGSETPATCTWTPSISAHLCNVSGKLAGTANFKVIDKATVALATVAAVSNSVAVRVSTGVPTTVKLAFDKATYAPGEKAQVQVLVLDAAGLPVAEQTVNALFAAGGISSSSALGTGSDTLTATFANIAGATSATAGTVVHHQVYTVYMPFASGDLTISATGSTGLATVGRVAVSAATSVVNSSVDAATDAANEATDAANAATDAALAAADAADAATAAAQDAADAVAALSTRVSTLVSNLRKQITALTKLVQRLL